MKLLTAVAALALLTGCATGPTGANYVPMVDLKPGQDSTYNADLADCQAYAARTATAMDGAVGGAIAGAILGLAFNAVLGGGHRSAWAGSGALSGALSGAGAAETGQRDVIRRCLVGRGYVPLN